MNIGSVVPKPNGVSFKDKEFGLPNYLLVGLLALLLVIASNTVLIVQTLTFAVISSILTYPLIFPLLQVLQSLSTLSLSMYLPTPSPFVPSSLLYWGSKLLLLHQFPRNSTFA